MRGNILQIQSEGARMRGYRYRYIVRGNILQMQSEGARERVYRYTQREIVTQ